MCGIGGLAVYATAPRVSRPALAHVASVKIEAPAPDEVLVPPRDAADYATQRGDLNQLQAQLAVRHAKGEDVVDLAQEAVAQHLGAMVESWIGTPYGFFGTSEEPGGGRIACGFFVSTLLEHAGFDVQRIELGKEPSERIVQTMVAAEAIERFDKVPHTNVVQRAVAAGPGIYLVGLDTHTGFLIHDTRAIRFCHATSRKANAVVCEPARESRSLRSDYTVLGKLGAKAAVAWLEGRALRPPS
ncbi:MAG: hypothetical protein AAGA48_05300 [Myxococcota bacterium]